MKIFGLHSISKLTQSIVSVITIVIVSITCFFTVSNYSYQVTALILLLAVSILSILFDIIPVLMAAFLSAIIWNFFFIPPIFTFHIAKSEDAFLFFMYFVVALVNATFTYKIRDVEKKVRDKEEKENTIKLYNTLLNSLSHELKTPIATIIGSIDTLKDNYDSLTSDNRSELLTQISTASIRLNKEVENLLSISRLETGVLKLKYDWCDLVELINIVINKIENNNSTHSISFEIYENMPLAKLDSVLIQHALFNLVNNAVQYTPMGTKINIIINIINDQVIIIVEDDGPGFPLNEQTKVFDRFYRLPQNKTGGSGLGLSIVKGFIEAHQGRVQLISEPGKGAKFIITLPVEITYVNKLKHE